MKIFKWIRQWKEKRENRKRFKKKLEELQKNDPFIYNH